MADKNNNTNGKKPTPHIDNSGYFWEGERGEKHGKVPKTKRPSRNEWIEG